MINSINLISPRKRLLIALAYAGAMLFLLIFPVTADLRYGKSAAFLAATAISFAEALCLTYGRDGELRASLFAIVSNYAVALTYDLNHETLHSLAYARSHISSCGCGFKGIGYANCTYRDFAAWLEYMTALAALCVAIKCIFFIFSYFDEIRKMLPRFAIFNAVLLAACLYIAGYFSTFSTCRALYFKVRLYSESTYQTDHELYFADGNQKFDELHHKPTDRLSRFFDLFTPAGNAGTKEVPKQ